MSAQPNFIQRIGLAANTSWSDRLALTDGHQQFTYAELAAAVKSLANWIARQKVNTVALHGINSIDWVLIDLACQDEAVKCIPLPDFFVSSQLHQCIFESQVDLLLSSSDELISEVLAGNTTCRQLSTPFSLKALRIIASTEDGQAVDPCPATTQKITFTSGSTGVPKGVCLSADHQWLTAQSIATAIDIRRPRHLCLLPLATLLENVAGVYAPLLKGGTVIVPNDQERGLGGSSSLDAKQLLTCISSYKPTTLILIPQLLSVLVAACQQGWCPPESLEFIAIGGAKVSPDLLNEATNLGLPVFEGYGLSECGSVVALNTPSANQPGSVGKILEHCELHIEDGEVIVTDSLFLGYLGEQSSWRPKSFKTGDLGELNGGFLSINGRSKNILISSFGRNINPEWVESELLAHPLLRQCVVVGDSRPYLSALLRADQSINPQQIQKWIDEVNTKLPDYAQVKAWLCLSDSEWNSNLTANGRPKRNQINTNLASKIDTLYKPNTNLQNLSTMHRIDQTFFEKLQAQTEQSRAYLLSAPIIQRCMQGDVVKDEYVAFLIQAFHHVKHTTPLLMSAGAHMPSHKEWLREALAEYIEEELGHQEWILNDIGKCGFDKEVARASQPNSATELMVAYAYDMTNRVNPVGFFGMVYVLEGTSAAMADQAADNIRRALNLPESAFSYLRSHGSLDQEHVKFFENLVNKIDDSTDQAQIIHCANMFYHLYGNVFRELDGSQAKQLAA